MFRLLILASAGEGIGYGHLTRCQAIQHKFRENGDSCDLILDFVGKEKPDKLDVLSFSNWISDFKSLEEFTDQYDAVLIDTYRADKPVYDYLERLFSFVVVLDDFNRLAYTADIIINPNVFAKTIDFSNQTAFVTGGREYVILRPQILNTKVRDSFSEKCDRITITVGGCDDIRLIPRLIDGLSGRYHLKIIAASERYKNELGKYQNENCNIVGYCNAWQMAKAFIDADLVISAGGQTLNELAYLGIPTIGIQVSYDQKLNVNYYCKMGFILEKLKWDDTQLLWKIDSQLEKLQNRDLREKLSTIGKMQIDGRGATRIRDLIIAKSKEQ